MPTVTRTQVLMMAATIFSGIVANPCMAAMVADQYARQNLLQQTLWDVQNMFSSSGIEIVEG